MFTFPTDIDIEIRVLKLAKIIIEGILKYKLELSSVEED